MIAALIFHKGDFVPTDTVSIAIVLTLTCFFAFAVSTTFCRASLPGIKPGVLSQRKRMTHACLPGFMDAPC